MSLDLVTLALAKKYADEKAGGSSNLDNYATKEYVDNAIKEMLANNLSTETWTFQMADGSNVSKEVYVK